MNKPYKYLKEIKQFIGCSVIYDEWGGGYIWGKSKKDDLQMIAQVEEVDKPSSSNFPIVSVRGWGAIQHLFKSDKEQREFQDELGQFIAEAINEKLNK